MQSRITVLTLAVEDLERAMTFYRDGLGLQTEGVVGEEFEHGAVAFFRLEGGLMLALWPASSLEHDTGLPAGHPNPLRFTIGHNVNSKGEVDSVIQQAIAAGATLVKPAGDTFYGGNAGYFQDPDGHLWDIVWNPELIVPS